MGIELGRISGPLLSANLLRDGIDLAFETDLLYIDVINGRIGIRSDAPTRTLFVNNAIGSTNLVVDTQFSSPNFTISTNIIQNVISLIYLQPDQTTDPKILTNSVSTANLNFSSNLISNLVSNDNINFRPDGLGKVVVNAESLYVNGNIHSTGNITFDGTTITFGDNDTDNVTFEADVASAFIPDINDTYNLGSPLKAWRNIYATNIAATESTVGNVISSTLTNNTFTKLLGNTVIGDASADRITFNALLDSNLVPALDNTYTLGERTTPNNWNTAFLTDLTNGVVDIHNNEITTITTDTNLVFGADGTGVVSIPTSDVTITNNLAGNTADLTGFNNTGTLSLLGGYTYTITGDIIQTNGDLKVTGTFANNNIKLLAPSTIEIPNVKIDGPTIAVTSANSDLLLQAAGTGGVIFDRQLKINDNVISNVFNVNDISLSYNNLYLTEDGQLLLTEDGDNYLVDLKNDRDLSIIFEPHGTGNAIIDSTKAIAIPFGNNTNRSLDLVGEIRQNSTTNLYEGYTPFGLISFNNIYDSDRNTYITPELTPGANDNTIRFYVNGSLRSTIDSTKLFSSTIQGGNVVATGNTISNTNTATDIFIAPTGTGVVDINNVSVANNSITNNSSGPLILESTGTGYIKFAGTGAVVFPAGTDAERLATPELGALRYNTDQGYEEIWNGTAWVNATGTSNQASLSEVLEIMDLWALVLG